MSGEGGAEESATERTVCSKGAGSKKETEGQANGVKGRSARRCPDQDTKEAACAPTGGDGCSRNAAGRTSLVWAVHLKSFVEQHPEFASHPKGQKGMIIK